MLITQIISTRLYVKFLRHRNLSFVKPLQLLDFPQVASMVNIITFNNVNPAPDQPTGSRPKESRLN